MSQRRASLAALPRKITRRFTTLEGFREIGELYVIGSNVQIFSVRHQFDPESYDDDRTSWTAPSAPQRGTFNIENEVKEESLDPTVDSPGAPRENHTNAAVEPLYHIFSKKEIWTVVITIGVAGLFSGLSSNIYFPALDAIAKDLRVSMSAVSLTITSYLIIQGLSPLFWGSLSDTIGRRQIYIYSFTVYILANIGLSLSPNFAVLLIFRGLQAAGSASTVSIGNGVIQDIIPPAERGGYISFYQAIRNFSIAVGPVLGGVFANFLGFRSIFVFLLIISSLTVLVIVLFLPETLRTIAGNGSTPLQGIHEPLIRKIRKKPSHLEKSIDGHITPKITARIFVEPLFLLKEKDILLSLLFGGTIYAIWSMVTSSTTGLFKAQFQLNEVLLGLAFIPNGLGTIVGSTIIGNLMNRSYTEAEERYKEQNDLPSSYKLPKRALPLDFPIEHARLKHIPWITIVFFISTTLYGFSLSSPAVTSKPGWIAVPLVLQFLIAATSNAVFAINQTMVSDLCPGKGASSTAINNLVRCSMGAIGVALIDMMIAAMGSGGAFLGLSLITVAVAPLATVQWYWGATWRKERVLKKERIDGKQGDGMIA
ncbi:major facilitator superfamily transporter [Paraphoma chrysanthemicola]|uniref:Major facilitator superfamily transporter n=1 Tax=Paraphoma chrysanthemicola TaxID=798071 RepID=A0A8K0RCF7_9PLEO|nr:major facilitator superfamily transporter [Paraphoma chrysanthemicola]